MEGTPEAGEPVQLRDPDGHALGIGDFDSDGPVAVRRLGLPHEQADGFVPRQLRRALERRAQLVDDPRYCRVVNDEGDGLPGLTVDRFESHFAIQTTTRAMDARKMSPILAKMVSARAQELTQQLAAADPQVADAGQAATPDANALPQIVGH